MDMSVFKKVDGWYKSPDRDWEMDLYGFFPNGLGDLIYSNLRKIIEDDDKSDWAYEVFDKCIVLLIQGKRWPDELEPPKVKDKKRYRSQRSITRDPWVMFYAAAIHLGKREFISLKPQWRLYRPTLWELRKALLGKKNAYKFWIKVSKFLARKDYVKTLIQYMDWSYDRRI